ncbi:MAG: hypothetical protein BGO68_05540 [Candidatus Amoebophilus sp. 36-38]|nr:MAG: hypothetical protein BGO68_05540 [Candidatus Amoebophilus sp. 36-38]
MNRNYKIGYKLVAVILLLSLFLQSCGHPLNQLVPQEEKELVDINLRAIKQVDISPLLEKTVTLEKGYLATFDKGQDGSLLAKLKADESQEEYKELPVVIEEGTDLAAFLRLDEITQRNRIQLSRKNGKIERVIILNGEVDGGMMESQGEKEKEEKEESEKYTEGGKEDGSRVGESPLSTMQTTFLSQLLPYQASSRKNRNLQRGLKEYRVLLKTLFEAVSHMQKQDLERFDGLVGENACQIRAVWIALFALRNPIQFYTLQNQIIHTIDKIDVLLKPQTIPALMHSEETLQTVLTKENLDLLLNHQELFILKCYLLTEMQTVLLEDAKLTSICLIAYANPKKLQRFGDISIAFAKNLLSKIRKMLATSSVEFVRNCAATSHLQRMVSQEFTREHNTLPCIPMFWSCKTIFTMAEQAKIPLILCVKFLERNLDGLTVIGEEFLYFQVKTNGSYVATEPNEIDLDKPACVIQGIAVTNQANQVFTKFDWKSSIEKNGIIDIILACAADHKQYPNPEHDQHLHGLNDSEYEYYKALAKRKGFSFDNPTTFFVQHIYATIVGNLFKKRFNANTNS